MVLGRVKQFVIDHLIIRQKMSLRVTCYLAVFSSPSIIRLHPSVIPSRKTKDDLNFTMCLEQLVQGSHFFGLKKFHDISMIFPGFLVNFQVFFSLFLKYDFQVVLNINMQTYQVSF